MRYHFYLTGTFTHVRNMTSQEALLLCKTPKETLYSMNIINLFKQQFKFLLLMNLKQV